MPLLISELRGVLLDIEGTTSSIAFVYDVMFPFVRANLRAFMQSYIDRDDVRLACDQLAKDAGKGSLSQWLGTLDPKARQSELIAHVHSLMDRDQKTTGLKSLQGLIWESGFKSGQLVAHLYPDVEPAIRRWVSAKLDVRIFSSGSVSAQKLFFGHTRYGNLLDLFSGHYDTTLGSKKECSSFQRIANEEFGLPASQILFVSDVVAELDAAVEAGMRVAACCREGNAPIPESCPYQRIESFEQLPTRKGV